MSAENSTTSYWGVPGGRGGQPRTLVRRRQAPEGTIDEILEADFTWQPTGVLVLHFLNMYEHELQPLSERDALAYEREWAGRPVRPAPDASE